MGLLDELKKLTKPYSGDEYDDFGDELSEVPPETPVKPVEQPRRSAPVPPPPLERKNPFSDFETGHQSIQPKREKVVNLSPQNQVQVVLVKPERFETAAEIADHRRERRPVLLNLEQTNKDIARRLIDFLSGVAYAQDGKVRKIAANIFMLTPYNVDVLGDLLDELENTSLYL
jgi:cell division inhibitor SepF